jgi:AcrR family transcriptional regulator
MTLLHLNKHTCTLSATVDGRELKRKVSEQISSPSGRKLQLRARALRQAQTRQRIVEAAVTLHQERGVLRTTITAIAERAGVERLTVYRHFPDEYTLHAACQQHFFAAHPPPELARWVEITDFAERVQAGLEQLYHYWQDTQDMFSSVLRDHEVDPDRAGAGVVAFMTRAVDALLTGHRGQGRHARLRTVATGHAVHFYTWRNLVHHQGLSNTEAATLMTRFITEQ